MVSEVLILGGGLAGSASAVQLARTGIAVQLLERETGPHDKICGEFLSIEAQHDLGRLGLDPVRLGAVPIDRFRVVRGRNRIETSLPFAALGVSRKYLDEALLELASSAGSCVERGVRVTGLGEQMAFTNQGARTSDHIFLATGKHDIRGAGRSRNTESHTYVGFKMHWRLSRVQRANMDRTVELILFNGGYAGLQPVSPDIVNLCLIIRQSRLAVAGGRWETLLAMLLREPHLAERLEDAEALFPKPLAIANLPYGFLWDAASTLPANMFRLGDQAAMTASLTGDGMAAALRSAHLAAKSLLAGENATTYHRKLTQLLSGQVRRAMFLQRATELPLVMFPGFAILRRWPKMLGFLARITRLPGWTS